MLELVTRSTRICFCKGWLSYDKMFREHVEKQPTTSWSILHPSLTFLSQRVEATTCPRYMRPDHGKADCALASLEYQRSCCSDPGRLSGTARKRFCREGTPQFSTQTPGAPAKVNYFFPTMRGSASVIPNLVTGSTDVFVVARITGWWIAQQLLSHPLPEL